MLQFDHTVDYDWDKQVYYCLIVLRDTEAYQSAYEMLDTIPLTLVQRNFRQGNPNVIIEACRKARWPEAAIVRLAELANAHESARRLREEREAQQRAAEARQRDPFRRLAVALGIDEAKVRNDYKDLDAKAFEEIVKFMESVPTPDVTTTPAQIDEILKELDQQMQGRA